MVQPPDASAARILTIEASPLYIQRIDIPADSVMEIWTSSSSAGADPVMHLLRKTGPDSYEQVHYSDNSAGSLEAYMSYYNTPGSAPEHVLVLRAKGILSTGTTFLTGTILTGGANYEQIPGLPDEVDVNGTFLPANLLFEQGPDEQLYAVLQPGGSLLPVLAEFSDSQMTNLTHLAMDGGVGGGVSTASDGSAFHYVLGTAQFRMESGEYVEPRVGLTTLYVNDEDVDSDGDGVGDQLEAVLGTCSDLSNCPYVGTKDPRDTDRDGLADGDEVFGVAGTVYSPDPRMSDDLTLPRWGANPLHKDIFLEIDYLAGIRYNDSDTNDLAGNPYQYRQDMQTLDGWIDVMVDPFAEGPADHLRNPDGLDGVALHMDIGVEPDAPADEATYGAWNSASARMIVPDFRIKVLAPVDGQVIVDVNGVQVDYTASIAQSTASLAGVIATMVETTSEPVEVGSIEYDADDDAYVVNVQTTQIDIDFEASISVPSAYEESIETERETNASLRARFRDPNHTDAVRLGRLRHAVVTGWSGGGCAGTTSVQLISASNATSIRHELGHTLGLQHWGHNDWGFGDVNCVPHYHSLMNYAYSHDTDVGFESTDVPVSINPTQVDETAGFPAGFDPSYLEQSPWYRTVDGGDVDWDMSGDCEPAGVAIRGITNAARWGNCGTYDTGRWAIDDALETPVSTSMDLVRANSFLWMGYYARVQGNMQPFYRSAHLGSVANSSCTGSNAPNPASGQQCLTWSSERSLSLLRPCQGLSMTEWEGDIIVAYRDDEDHIGVARYALERAGSGALTGALVKVHEERLLGNSRYAPELSVVYAPASAGLGWTERLEIFYVDASAVNSRDLRHYYLDANGSWTHAFGITNTSGYPIHGGESPSLVPWPDPYNTAFSADERTVCGLFPDPDRLLRFFCLIPATQQWEDLTATVWSELWACSGNSCPHEPRYGCAAGTGRCVPRTAAKPTLAFRPQRLSTGALYDLAGHSGSFHAVWPQENEGYTAAATVSTAVSASNPPQNGGFLFPTDHVLDYFAGDFTYLQAGTNLPLYDDSTMGGMMGFAARERTNASPVLHFYPLADGIPNTTMTVYSDFGVMEPGICKNLERFWDAHVDDDPLNPTPRPFSCGESNVLEYQN